MFDWIVLHSIGVVDWFAPYAEWFFLSQVAGFVGVMVKFEYHWEKVTDDAFIARNKGLIAKLDQTSYDGIKLILALMPFGCIGMLIRSHIQKYDSVAFLKDYGVKRSL